MLHYIILYYIILYYVVFVLVCLCLCLCLCMQPLFSQIGCAHTMLEIVRTCRLNPH